MNFKLILFGCILACLAVTQIAAQCACGAEGEDVCSSCSAIRVPRPQPPRRLPSRPNPRQNGCTCSTCSQNPPRFRPVGDRCSCGNSAVLPANRPRSLCQKKYSSSSLAIEDPFDSNIYTNNHIKKEKYSSLIPADPVSIDLAYKLAQRAKVVVPEEKLAYGFKRVPANAQNVKPVPNIPEEKLYNYEKKVVELKPISCHKHKSEEEEDEVEEEEEDTKPNCGLGYLNLKEMGYQPQKHVDPQFAVTQFDAESTEPETPCDKHPIQEIGDCGYKPGRIVDNTYNDDLPAYVVSGDDDDNFDD